MKKSIEFAIEKKPGVYRLQNLITGKFYIGSSKNLYKRYYSHRKLLQKKIHDNIRIKEDSIFFGENSFVFGVVEYCEEEKLKDREQYFFELWNPTYNVWNSVYNATGRTYTEDQLKKFKTQKRIKNHTEETKKKFKEIWALRKLNLTPEELKKRQSGRKGIPHSEETKKMYSLQRKGRKKPIGFSEKIRQIRLNDSKELKEYRKIMIKLKKGSSNGI